MLRSDGWVFSESDGASQTIKPGWLARDAGSVLWIEAETNFSAAAKPDVDSATDGEALVIGVTYLSSYEHMGVFEVSCVTGCTCNATEVDGHTEQKHSVPLVVEFDVVQVPSVGGEPCVVQVLVLNRTSSGEHKAKVTQLFVESWAGV